MLEEALHCWPIKNYPPVFINVLWHSFNLFSLLKTGSVLKIMIIKNQMSIWFLYLSWILWIVRIFSPWLSLTHVDPLTHRQGRHTPHPRSLLADILSMSLCTCFNVFLVSCLPQLTRSHWTWNKIRHWWHKCQAQYSLIFGRMSWGSGSGWWGWDFCCGYIIDWNAFGFDSSCSAMVWPEFWLLTLNFSVFIPRAGTDQWSWNKV